MTTPLRVLIVDDEATARRRMHRMLSALDGVEVAGERDSAEAMLATLDDDDVDVVLLDIQMTGMTGLEARALLPEDGPYVIFATAHPEHAVKAFELGAVDYVLKPVDEPRLALAIERAKKHYARRAAPESRASASLPRLAIETTKGIVLIAPEDVSHAVLDGALVAVHASEGGTSRAYVTDMQLVDLEKRLGELVERVHRKALVNFAYVARLEPQPTGGYLAHMKNGDRVEISRQSARRIRRRLGIT
ncbi:MAG: LytTR family DNA-binding domain-containing protein [Sandaracinaceae bacterium]|nr:LytTR family DNA-binding domain-containing protein [Sandaracinaceae bacterium]